MKKMQARGTLIISVYKNVQALEAVLHSLEKQTVQDFEVIISEDGEDAAMAAFVASYAWRWPMQHLTQADKDWRKERILNKSVLAAKTDWLVFIDGDCVLHPRFMEWHLRYRQRGVMLAGKRIKLSPALSEAFLAGKKINFFPYLFARRGCRYVEEVFYCGLAQWLRRPVKHLVGSNMSMSRADLLQINGFDEHYTLPATGEDYDIEWRMQAAGCRIVSLRNLAIQYHLWHKENWQDHEENMVYCRACQEAGKVVCEHGIQSTEHRIQNTEPKVSVIVGFYNKIELLEKVLESLVQQTFRDFEVVIADDGSKPEVVERIKELQGRVPLVIQHVWHEDDGWRKNRILNRAVAASRGQYLVFIDGDCIVDRRFVEEHYAEKAHGQVLSGRRVLMGPHATEYLLAERLTQKRFGAGLTWALLRDTLSGYKTRMEHKLHISSNWLRKLFAKDYERFILGCNFSLYKDDLLRVNGFDERFQYPGYGEDIDLWYRLGRAGIKTFSRKGLLVEYHCYHKRFDTNYAPNQELMRENNEKEVTWTPYGIKQ